MQAVKSKYRICGPPEKMALRMRNCNTGIYKACNNAKEFAEATGSLVLAVLAYLLLLLCALIVSRVASTNFQ